MYVKYLSVQETNNWNFWGGHKGIAFRDSIREIAEEEARMNNYDIVIEIRSIDDKVLDCFEMDRELGEDTLEDN